MYRMAAYCRLSKEDGENRISESIENQMHVIRDYIDHQPDLELTDIYIDDGFSGLRFDDRPEFKRMMQDIETGRIQGVITKDISRLGREHIETSNYMERIFPSRNIRYIAILDRVDSLHHENEELAQFKTLLNDMYSRDISKKIRSSLNAQKKQGQFVSGFAPYGYRKDPQDKHRFLIDEEAAQIVRMIFTRYLAGERILDIARHLNDSGFLTPSEYKRKVLGLSYSNALEKFGHSVWSYSTIYTILNNQVYTGAMVQHKSEKLSYKIEKYRKIPEAERYIVEHMHEAIIEKELFVQVREKMKRKKR